MRKLGIAALAVGGAMLPLDAIWLSLMAEQLYRAQLPGVMLEGFRLGPAVAFYLLYIVGIVFFAVRPALEGGGIKRAAFNGAILGLVCYGTYDLTNYATMKVWSPLVTVVDMAWGTFLTACAASFGTWIASRKA